jgi:hypothetical protein
VCGDFCGVKNCKSGELVVLAEAESRESSMTDEVGILANLLVDLPSTFMINNDISLVKKASKFTYSHDTGLTRT